MAQHTIDQTQPDPHPIGIHRHPGLEVHSEFCPLGELRTTAIGELDASTRPILDAHLAALPLQCHTLDLRFLAFIDAAGGALVAEAVANGVATIVTSPIVDRVLRLCGLTERIDADPTSGRGHLHCATFGVAIFDHDLRFTYVNDAMAAIHGMPADVHIGYRANELLATTTDSIDLRLDAVRLTGQAERFVVNGHIGGVRGAYDCYVGPADVDGRRGVISTVTPLDVDRVPDAIEISMRAPQQPRSIDDATHDPQPELTAREQQVLDAIADGHTNQEIADQLFLSIDTVKTYCRRLFTKLGVTNRTQAAVLAHQRRA